MRTLISMYHGDDDASRASQEDLESRLGEWLLLYERSGNPLLAYCAFVNMTLRFILAAEGRPDVKAAMLEGLVLALGNNCGSVSRVDLADPHNEKVH